MTLSSVEMERDPTHRKTQINVSKQNIYVTGIFSIDTTKAIWEFY